MKGANDALIATMDHLAVANLLNGDPQKAAMVSGECRFPPKCNPFADHPVPIFAFRCLAAFLSFSNMSMARTIEDAT